MSTRSVGITLLGRFASVVQHDRDTSGVNSVVFGRMYVHLRLQKRHFDNELLWFSDHMVTQHYCVSVASFFNAYLASDLSKHARCLESGSIASWP